MTIDLKYDTKMTVLINGEEQKIKSIDSFSEEENYGSCEWICKDPHALHCRLTVPDDKVKIEDGNITFEKMPVVKIVAEETTVKLIRGEI